MQRISITFLALVALVLAGASISAARQPNIVILLADDLGYADVGFHGCRDIPTPNLDALAASGVRFTNAYVSCPYCSPSRAGLLTGRYQQRFGHEFNPGPHGEPTSPNVDMSIGLPVAESTIADRLRAAGYATGLVGKWHQGVAPKFHPQQRGFDEFFGFLGGAHIYQPGLPNVVFPGLQDPAGPAATHAAAGQPALHLPWTAMFRGTEAVDEPEYLTDAFAREAVSFIDRHQKQPFFLYLAFNASHTPMHATDDRLAKFASVSDPLRRSYCAMTLALDEAIGTVLEKLRSTHLEQETLVFFFSDNGGPTVPRAALNASSNKPLRGSKVATLEGGIRVPFVVSWKDKLPAGRVFEQPIIQLDVLPTALAAAGVAAKADWQLDGVDLAPYLTGEKAGTPHDVLYWRLGQQMAIRHGNWKLVKYATEFAGEKETTEFSPPRLYDLSADLGETNDLSGKQPAKVKELTVLWEAWNNTLAAPAWPQRFYAPSRPPAQR